MLHLRSAMERVWAESIRFHGLHDLTFFKHTEPTDIFKHTARQGQVVASFPSSVRKFEDFIKKTGTPLEKSSILPPSFLILFSIDYLLDIEVDLLLPNFKRSI